MNVHSIKLVAMYMPVSSSYIATERKKKGRKVDFLGQRRSV